MGALKENKMRDFEIIYKDDLILGDYLICNHCGERVERGIVTVSHHWMHCLKRTDGLIVIKKSLNDSGVTPTPNPIG